MYPSILTQISVIYTTLPLQSFVAMVFFLFSFFHTFVLVSPCLSSNLSPLPLTRNFPALFLTFPSHLICFFPSLCSFSTLSSPSSSPTFPSAVGKWGAARVPVWTGTLHGAVALPGPNSLALVVMWTSSRHLPRQHHLPRLPPSTSIRKMDKPLLRAFLTGGVHSKDKIENGLTKKVLTRN